MAVTSAGLLLYRRTGAGEVEVLVAHMGGPFWAGRDAGAWSIPKGEHDPEEPALDAARREFAEELGSPAPAGEPHDLGELRQAGGKLVRAFALEGDLDTTTVHSNSFRIEWPPRSGRMAEFPEIDRAEWMSIERARTALVKGQRAFLDRLPATPAGYPPPGRSERTASRAT